MTTFTAAGNHRGGPASAAQGPRQLFPLPLLSLDARPDFGKKQPWASVLEKGAENFDGH